MKHEEPIKANHNWIITTKTCHVKNTKFSAIASERLKKGIKGTSKGKTSLSSLSMEELTKLRKKNNFCRLCLWIHICTNQGWCLLKMDNFDQTAVSMMATIEFLFKKNYFFRYIWEGNICQLTRLWSTVEESKDWLHIFRWITTGNYLFYAWTIGWNWL